jgi:SAM-dependent methyltransferase
MAQESGGKHVWIEQHHVMPAERDYVLGTNDEELARLGLQHRVWREVVLDCWRKAGITAGKRVLDVGAGPGYAVVDLAEIVGPSGEIVALERSSKFVHAAREACRARALSNVRIHELDLMSDDFPEDDFDFSWCRWVASFVSAPTLLIEKIGRVLRKNGVAIFHEYAAYKTWGFVPPRPAHDRFVDLVMKSWREAGGEPDIAMSLPRLLEQNGFIVRSARPHIFCIRPAEEMWQWPAAFIRSGAARLQEIGLVDSDFIAKLHREFADAAADPNSLMLTPLVLEIVAQKNT